MTGTETAKRFLCEAVERCDAALDRCLPIAETEPQRLHEAMRYAIFGGGKRVRPALVLAACRACGGTDTSCEPAMAAVELLHTYTLVHDDLPAMDDDDLRRGRATCHKAYNEATAILVGDALLTLAMHELARLGGEAVRCLAAASGSQGVVGGQQDDLDAEGSTGADAARLERIHRGKTAALIRASCELGALAAEAPAEQRQRLAAFGESIGLAFQVIDDVLDATQDSAQLGKTAGKDAANGKLTYVAVHGLEAARAEADRLAEAARAELEPFSDTAADLRAIGEFIIRRQS